MVIWWQVVRTIRTKNYQNVIIGFQVTVENVGDVFLRLSVVCKNNDKKLFSLASVCPDYVRLYCCEYLLFFLYQSSCVQVRVTVGITMVAVLTYVWRHRHMRSIPARVQTTTESMHIDWILMDTLALLLHVRAGCFLTLMNWCMLMLYIKLLPGQVNTVLKISIKCTWICPYLLYHCS